MDGDQFIRKIASHSGYTIKDTRAFFRAFFLKR